VPQPRITRCWDGRFVEFKTPAAATAALAFNGKPLDADSADEVVGVIRVLRPLHALHLTRSVPQAKVRPASKEKPDPKVIKEKEAAKAKQAEKKEKPAKSEGKGEGKGEGKSEGKGGVPSRTYMLVVLHLPSCCECITFV
jgi:hypothetical protein